MPPSRHVVAATFRFIYRLRGLSLRGGPCGGGPCGAMTPDPRGAGARAPRSGFRVRARSPHPCFRALARCFSSAAAPVRSLRSLLPAPVGQAVALHRRHQPHLQSARCARPSSSAWRSKALAASGSSASAAQRSRQRDPAAALGFEPRAVESALHRIRVHRTGASGVGAGFCSKLRKYVRYIY